MARPPSLDRAAWERFALALPALFQNKAVTDPIRAWVPSTPDVAFGVALALLHEAEERRHRGPIRVIGSGTDPAAVRAARLGRVSRQAARHVPATWRGAHLSAFDRRTLQADSLLRQHLVFSRHDPGWDPPFVQLDLIVVCGLDADAPGTLERLAEHFWFALRDGGVLWLERVPLAIDVERFDRLPSAPGGYRKLGRYLPRAEIDALIADVIASERLRVGEELHDAVGQHVAAASLFAHRIHERNQDPRLEETLRDLDESIAATRRELRAVMRGQFPIEIDGRNLAEALRESVAVVTRVLPLASELSAEGEFGWVDAPTASHLVRIAQEAVRNAGSAGARRVEVTLRATEGGLHLEVRDDGAGLVLDERANIEGLGLRIMRYRARTIGASLHFLPSQSGTIVACTLARGRPEPGD